MASVDLDGGGAIGRKCGDRAAVAGLDGRLLEEVEQTTRENAFALFTKVPR